MNYKNIVACIDYSEITENVLKKAHVFSEDHKAKLSVLHIIEPSPLYGFSGGLSDMSEIITKEAYNDIAPICKKYDIDKNSIHIQISPVNSGILEFLQKHEFDLLFMGSHGKFGISRLLGSCTNIISHSADCDIYIVRTER